MDSTTLTHSSFVDVDGRRLSLDDVLNNDIIGQAGALRAKFRSAEPFPHLVFDGLFSNDLLQLIWDDFERVGEDGLRRRQTDRELTYRSRADVILPTAAQIYFNTVNSAQFVRFLTDVTGIAGLITDSFLQRGGLHESRNGGKFNVHLDFNKHPVTNLDNRLVLITYLNRDWREDYGGVLELWSAAEQRCVAKVVPEFGRTILFEHSSISLHGHPHPIKTPDNRPRRSLAAYYYSNGVDDRAAQARYNTHFLSDPDETSWAKTMKAVKYVLPPVLVDAGRAVWQIAKPGRQ